MPRPNSLRVNTCLEEGGETEHAHICRLMKMHLQLFPAYLIGLLAVGVAAGTWQVKLHVFPSVQGKICHITFPLLNY